MRKKIGFLSHLDSNLYLFRLPIMQQLVAEGYEVFAICPQGNTFDKFAQYGITAVAYEIDRGSLNPLKELKAIYNIYQAIKPLNLKILHTFTVKPNVYGTIAGRAAGVPTIYNLVEGLGSFYVDEHLKSRLMRRVIEGLYKQVFRQADGVVFVNCDDPEYLLEKGIVPKEKVHIVRSVGIDTQLFTPQAFSSVDKAQLREALGLEEKIVVLMVSRAIWHKGIREFYEAAERLKAYANIRFVLAGDIDEGNPSCADRAFLKSGHVQWIGYRTDIAALTAVSDIYVLPSYREGVPRTLLEAASMSKPIITTDTVGCREVVQDGYNGYLVPLKNAKVLSEKIYYLAQNPKIREVMGKNGRIFARKIFDIHTVVEQYMELYLSGIKEKEKDERK